MKNKKASEQITLALRHNDIPSPPTPLVCGSFFFKIIKKVKHYFFLALLTLIHCIADKDKILIMPLSPAAASKGWPFTGSKDQAQQ